VSARGFARLDRSGNLVAAQSKGVIGVQPAVRASSGDTVHNGAYCFNLDFAPVSVIATSAAHPEDSPFGPILYTAGPDVAGELTKDQNGASITCPVGFQDAAVVGRVEAGDGLRMGPGGCFVLFN
jgi:hypothetical protein